MTDRSVTDRLKEKFPLGILEETVLRDELTLTVKKEQIVEVCRFLQEDPELAYVFLADLCGVDYFPREPRFEVVYHLRSLKNHSRLRLKVALEGSQPSLPSVTPIWQGANWLEREAYDLCGIVFEGHPDLRRILTPDDMKDHPLRKDFPLRGRDRANSS